jgi:hypothetical protein
MKINKGYIIMGLSIAFSFIFELAAHADESNLATTLTFSQPIQIPGQVLPAGSYLFKLVETGSDQHVVQIFSADSNVLRATLLTASAERRNATSDTVVTLAEQKGGRPDALVKWFYPGREIGNEFLYPKRIEKELSQDKQEAIVAKPTVSIVDVTGAGN